MARHPSSLAQSATAAPVSKQVIIQDKVPGGVLVQGQVYPVTAATLILDILGKQIDLCDLPVPCEAVIEYLPARDTPPECLLIETQKLLMGADPDGETGRRE